jgi:hypothetical protein
LSPSAIRRRAFWERPVVPTPPVDLGAMQVYRRSTFPAEGGPVPWLDRPDAQQQVAKRLASREISGDEAELCRKWSRDGYLILEGFYQPSLMDRTWGEYEAAIAAGRAVPPPHPFYEGDPLPGRMLCAHLQVPAVDEMLHEPRINHLVSVLLGAKAKPFQTIIGHKTSMQGEHSDSIHMTTYPAGYLAATWIAYEDVHPDAGPLVYYPGSHKLPYLLSEDVDIPPTRNYDGYHARYEPAIQRQISEHGLAPEYFLARKGDVLIWHANLLHGGGKLRNDRLSRKALVCHYFAEGAISYHDIRGSLTDMQVSQGAGPAAPARDVPLPKRVWRSVLRAWRR